MDWTTGLIDFHLKMHGDAPYINVAQSTTAWFFDASWAIYLSSSPVTSMRASAMD